MTVTSVPVAALFCADNDTGAVEFGSGKVQSCADAAALGWCNHTEYGQLAKRLCPRTCEACTAAGSFASASFSSTMARVRYWD